MNTKLKYIFIACMLLAGVNNYAQVVILPVHQHIETFQIDQLFQVSLINTSGNAVSGKLEITIEGQDRQQILKLASGPVLLEPGATIANDQIVWNKQLEIGSSQGGDFLRSTGRLPFGEYVFCYVFQSNGVSIGVNCQEQTIKIYGLPELQAPFNGENITTPTPLLSWKPPFPLDIPDIQYELRLAEYKYGQSPAQAIHVNFPLISVNELSSLLLPYPLDAYPLEEGKSYAWQVTARTGALEIGKTDIWIFHYRIKDTAGKDPQEPQSEGYRFVKNRLDGSYYQASRDIYFAYDNRYNERILEYSIVPLSSGHKPLSKIPQIELGPGINKICIRGSDLPEISAGAAYLLQVVNSKKKVFYYPFHFNDKKAK